MQSDSKRGRWLVVGVVVLLAVVLGMAAWWFENGANERLPERLVPPTRTVAEQRCFDQAEQIFGPQIAEVEASFQSTLQNPFLDETTKERILAQIATPIARTKERIIEAQVSFIRGCLENLPPSEAK